MNLTKRTLMKWRKEALSEVNQLDSNCQTGYVILIDDYIELSRRILRMTQILLDQHLMKGK